MLTIGAPGRLLALQEETIVFVALVLMVLTRTNLDLSKLSIYQVISTQEGQRLDKPSTSSQNNNMAGSNNTNIPYSTSAEMIETKAPILLQQPTGISVPTSTVIGVAASHHSPSFSDEIQQQFENQTVKTATTLPQVKTSNHATVNNDCKELARIPHYNGKTNIYAWLTAVKSVFIDLKYDETTWANKAKYYLSDHAVQFVYLHDDPMTNWNTFQKLMIDQYSPTTTSSDPTYTRVNTLVTSNMGSQQHSIFSSDTLAVKAHHALVMEDLKTLPKFMDEESQSINSWLEEIELVYNKALITDVDKCHRTLKLLSNVDDKWLEFIRRQKLDWNEFKQKLISRFEGKKDLSRIQLEDNIRNRRIYDNESMHQYYSDIMRKCDLLEDEYPVSDRHRIDYIIRGLPDSIQDQLLIREYTTPKELLEVLQKIEERRKRTNFEQHVFSSDDNVPSSIARTTPTLQRTSPLTTNVQLNTHNDQQRFRHNNNIPYNNQSQHYRPSSQYYNINHSMPSHPSSNYNQQRPQQQQKSIQCYNCGRYGHKATDCFKPKQHLN